MKNNTFKTILYCAILTVLSFSCKRANEVSIRMMNSKCKVSLSTYISIDSMLIDTSVTKVDEENLNKLLPEIQDLTQWEVFFYGKRKMGKIRSYALFLKNGENNFVRLVFLKGREPISNIEVAGNCQLEGNSYKVSASIPNDSTIITSKYQIVQTDEPIEGIDVNDSIITVYRIKPDGKYTIISSDTLTATPKEVITDDGEYSDEIFYYEGKSPASWAIAGINNPHAFKDFYMQFRNMVKLNDKDQIANYIQFPLGTIIDEADFVKNYEKVFTKNVRNAILGQKIRQLFRDQRGVMIGDNQLWFKQIKGEYKIVTLKK